jgi:peptidoglycan/LPS O-acetylase OafA/YrhL
LVIVPYVLAGAGHQAVIVFFVLSGYFISGSVFQAIERKRWLWKDYLLRRLLRLWVVLLPALLVCVLWDTLGRHLGHAPGRYPAGVFNPSAWWGNLLFVQTILVPVFGSDSALWSLANEFWYYMLFPLAFLAAHAATPRGLRLLYTALFLGGVWFVRGDVLRYFPIWLLGTLLVVTPPPAFSVRTGRLALALATPLYLLCFFGMSRNRSFSTWLGDYILSAAT